MPYSWINGFRIWYQLAGPTDGSPIVLMHGDTFDSTMWAEQVPVLAERFRVATIRRARARSQRGADRRLLVHVGERVQREARLT